VRFEANGMWKLRCDLGLGTILGHLLLWVIFGIVTCGFGFFLFPYSFGETVINATYMLDEHGRAIGKLRCTQGVGGHILHALGWWLLSIITLGIAAFFYGYRVASNLLDATVVERTAWAP
jgi:hypothetical protein